MNRAIAVLLFAASTTSFGLAACSQQTQEDAEAAFETAADDTEANAAVVGEAIEDGAIKASEEISEGAAALAEDLREGDEEEPGPAPITGDDLNQSPD